MCLGDISRHIGTHIDGFDIACGGLGIGKRNLEGKMLLEFYLEKQLCVSNIWFKREERER